MLTGHRFCYPLLFGGPATADIGLLLMQRTLRSTMRVAMLGFRASSGDARCVSATDSSVVPVQRFSYQGYRGLCRYCINTAGSFRSLCYWMCRCWWCLLAVLFLRLPTMILTFEIHVGSNQQGCRHYGRGRAWPHGTYVDVYERSSIGCLQTGCNRMMVGLAERDRLRELCWDGGRSPRH